MDKKVVFESKYGIATYTEELKLSSIQWKNVKTIPSSNYKELFDVLLTYSEERGVISYMSDSREGGVVSPEDRKWFQDVAVPRAAKAGLKHAAIVIKKDPFKKYYMNAILKVVTKKAPYNMKIFYNYDEAIDWIKSFNDYQ